MEPELEEFETLDGETELTPQLLGWLDVSDVLRAFLDRAFLLLGEIGGKRMNFCVRG